MRSLTIPSTIPLPQMSQLPWVHPALYLYKMMYNSILAGWTVNPCLLPTLPSLVTQPLDQASISTSITPTTLLLHRIPLQPNLHSMSPQTNFGLDFGLGFSLRVTYHRRSSH